MCNDDLRALVSKNPYFTMGRNNNPPPLSDIVLDTGNFMTEGDNLNFDWFNLDRQTVAKISALLKMDL